MASSARIEELEKKFNENPRRYFAPLANEYRKAGETEQAIALCRAYLPQQPGHMSGHIVFGQALFDAGQLDEAQSVFGTALGLDPENLIALRHLGDIALSRGDTAGARGWYQRVLDADPRNEEIAAQLASLDSSVAAAPAGEASQPGEAGSLGWGEINPEQSDDSPAEAERDELVLERASADSHLELSAPEARSTATDGATAAENESTAESDSTAVVHGGTSSEAAAAPEADEAPATAPPASRAEHSAGSAPSDLEDSIDIDELFSSAPSSSGQQAPSPAPDSTDRERAASGAATEGELEALDDAEVPEITAELPATKASAVADQAESGTPIDEQDADASAATGSDIGLEVMEFVPPASTGSSQRAHGFETGHEAVVGGPIGDGDEAPRNTGTPSAFVTETMAELYLQQGFVQEALNVYRQLLAQNPDDAGLRERVTHLEQGDRSSVSMAAVSDEVVEAARRRQTSSNRRSMRQFLGTLAARRAPQRSGEQPVIDAVADTAAEQLPGAAPAALPEDEPRTSENDSVAMPWESAEHEELPVGEAGSNESSWELPAPTHPADAAPAAGAGSDSTLDSLFDHPPSNPEDQAAAAALAGAFDAASVPTAPAPPRGRPTRAAVGELSLDNVFRESGGDAGLGRPRSDFSFDQFFSEEAGSSSSPAPSEPEPEPQDDAGSGDDIGQFNDWLEGLKKK